MKLFGKTIDFTKPQSGECKEKAVPRTFNIDFDRLTDWSEDYDVDMSKYNEVVATITMINRGTNNLLELHVDGREIIIGPELIRNSIIEITI